MAILRGFPPSNTISASVRITEKDLSFIFPDQSFHRAGMVGFASKGPVNFPIAIATNRQLHTVFGFPHPEIGDPYLIYAAEQFLLISNELFVVRVAEEDGVSDESATTAEVDVPIAGTLIEIISDTVGPYDFDDDSFFRWKVNTVLQSKTLVVLAGTFGVEELVEELNDQLDFTQDGIEFFVSDTDTIALRSVFAFGPDGEIELISVQNGIYGGSVVSGNPTGLGTGMTVATLTGSKDMFPDVGYQTPGTYDFTGLTDLNLQLVLDGTDNILIDNAVQVIDLGDLEGMSNVIADIVTEINSQRVEEGGTLPGGWIATATGDSLTISTLHHGRDARMRVKPDSSADDIFGLDNGTVIGTSPSGVTGDVAIETFGRVVGAEGSGEVTFTITADTAGIEGNNTQVVTTNETREGSFILQVFSDGVQVESWGGLTKDQASRFYVETFLALVSDFIRVIDNVDEGAPPLNGTFDLSGGSDGIPSDPDRQDELLIGKQLGQTGLFTLSEPEQIEIDLIAIPGHPSTSVVTALLDFSQNIRADCLAIIDPPFGLTVNEIVQWQNGSHPLNLTRFDSDFGALYWPWLRLRDNFNRVDVWVPPSGSVMAVIARSDFLSAPWFAPAGLTRGIVPSVNDVFFRPTLEERDTMYGNRNAVNPIIQFRDIDGFVVFGQKTLQRRPTALDRVNVRRLMFVIEKRIRRQSRFLLFDPHDEIFRARFVALATTILREIQVGRGINDFIIKADEELNTPDVIDRNEFRARIGIQPIRAVEFMFLEFSIHRTGSFGEAGAETF